MPTYTLRILGVGSVPEQDVSHVADNELEAGDQFVYEDVWREVAGTADADGQIIVLVRIALPIGAFTVGGRYLAELYREEARTLHDRVRRNRQARHTPERQALEAALSAILGSAKVDLSDDTVHELDSTIRSIQVEGIPLSPGLDWLRIQMRRYLDDLDRQWHR